MAVDLAHWAEIARSNEEARTAIESIIERWERDAAESAAIWKAQSTPGYSPDAMRRELAERVFTWVLGYAEDRIDEAANIPA